MSLPEHAYFSLLSHFNKNKLLMWDVDSSQSLPWNVAIPQQSPSPPEVLLFTGHTLITSLNLPYSPLPLLIFHLVTSAFRCSLRSDRCLPPLPAQQQLRLAKAESLPPMLARTADLDGKTWPRLWLMPRQDKKQVPLPARPIYIFSNTSLLFEDTPYDGQVLNWVLILQSFLI